ncbi:RICIN domain-containing protein [Teredinibacter haidensis]|uniref:RICIN domain-containing protein n=1 Tax=Teredinibacter haidensis TaxID=2731755 RepID=UPI0009489281|nr:RICIN domain-containing protein [Teredinibacter haidensis]
MFKKIMIFALILFLSSGAFAIDSGRYTIQSSLSGQFMDVEGGSSDDGANILQYSESGATNQQFDVVSLGDGSYSIRPAHSGKSLDVYAWNADDGAELRQWTYYGNSNQRWYIDNVGSGLYSITSVFSGKAIDVWEMSMVAGGDIRLYSYWGGAGQHWSFLPVGGSPSTSTINVYIAGDSTVSTYTDTASQNDQAGWGQMLAEQYNSSVNVQNHAVGGRTARRFIEEGRLDAIWNVIKSGDYLLVQFGTNDGNKTATYTINGQTIPYYLDPQTEFKTYLRQYISGARARGVTLVFVTPPPRNSAYCTGGNGTGAHAEAMRELAVSDGVALADLNEKTVNYLMAICPSPTPEDFFFLRADGTVDGTHFQENGARILSGFVADGVDEADLPLNSRRK